MVTAVSLERVVEGHRLIHNSKVNHSQAPRMRGEAATAGVDGHFLGPILSPPRVVSSSGLQQDTAGVITMTCDHLFSKTITRLPSAIGTAARAALFRTGGSASTMVYALVDHQQPGD